MFVVHDGVDMAHMGHPSAPYLSLGIRLSHPIDSGSRWSLLDRDPIVLGLSKSHLGRQRAAYAWWHFVSRARRAVMVGHTLAMSHLTRHRSVE